MSQTQNTHNGVESGTSCEGLLPGRCPIALQDGPGRHHTTACRGAGNAKLSRRGRGKVPWTREECLVLWECFIRSGGKSRVGYIKRVEDRGMTSVTTFLKGKVQSASTKIRWHAEKEIKTQQNHLFRNNQSQLYKELGGVTRSDVNQVPQAVESREFWSSIWSQKQEHNRETAWLDGVRERMANG